MFNLNPRDTSILIAMFLLFLAGLFIAGIMLFLGGVFMKSDDETSKQP